VLGSSVLTISFGAVRRLLLKSDDESETVDLAHGSLFMLGAETNAPGQLQAQHREDGAGCRGEAVADVPEHQDEVRSEHEGGD
jgi:hypothetical protein